MKGLKQHGQMKSKQYLIDTTSALKKLLFSVLCCTYLASLYTKLVPQVTLARDFKFSFCTVYIDLSHGYIFRHKLTHAQRLVGKNIHTASRRT